MQADTAKVCVVGVGGLGNPITTRLVAMGVENFESLIEM